MWESEGGRNGAACGFYKTRHISPCGETVWGLWRRTSTKSCWFAKHEKSGSHRNSAVADSIWVLIPSWSLITEVCVCACDREIQNIHTHQLYWTLKITGRNALSGQQLLRSALLLSALLHHWWAACEGVRRRLHAEVAFEWRTPSVPSWLHGVSRRVSGWPLLFVTSSPPFWHVSGVTRVCFLCWGSC